MKNIMENTSLMPIEILIHVVRGQQIIIDSDLGRLYGVETRTLNQAVKRNIDRFPEDFMFQLTKDETENLISQFATSSSGSQFMPLDINTENMKSQNVISSWGGTRKRPYAFTENGIVDGSIKDLGKKIVAFSQLHLSPAEILSKLN